jgi:hypothetical protein
LNAKEKKEMVQECHKMIKTEKLLVHLNVVNLLSHLLSKFNVQLKEMNQSLEEILVQFI